MTIFTLKRKHKNHRILIAQLLSTEKFPLNIFRFVSKFLVAKWSFCFDRHKRRIGFKTVINFCILAQYFFIRRKYFAELNKKYIHKMMHYVSKVWSKSSETPRLNLTCNLKNICVFIQVFAYKTREKKCGHSVFHCVLQKKQL